MATNINRGKKKLAKGRRRNPLFDEIYGPSAKMVEILPTDELTEELMVSAISYLVGDMIRPIIRKALKENASKRDKNTK